MASIFLSLIPLVALVLLGWCLLYSGVFNVAGKTALSLFAFHIAMPVLLFHRLATTELPPVVPWRFLFVYLGSAVFVLIVMAIVAQLWLKQSSADGAVLGITGAFGNTVMLGIPFNLVVLGEEALLPALALLPFHGPTLLLTASLVAGFGGIVGSGQSSGKISENLWSVFSSLANPIIAAILLGVLWSFLGIPMPKVLDSTLNLLGEAAIPTAMIALGMSLVGLRLTATPEKVLLTVFGKLALFPIAVGILVFYVVDLPPVWAAVCLLNACLPTGVNAFMFAQIYRTSENSTSSAIVWGMLLFLPLYLLVAALLVPKLN